MKKKTISPPQQNENFVLYYNFRKPQCNYFWIEKKGPYNQKAKLYIKVVEVLKYLWIKQEGKDRARANRTRIHNHITYYKGDQFTPVRRNFYGCVVLESEPRNDCLERSVSTTPSLNSYNKWLVRKNYNSN